jgi:hypothetical protein
MKRKIIGVFVCTLLIVTVFPTIGTNALIQNTSNQPTIDPKNPPLYFKLNSKNWSYKNGDIQIQTTRNNSNSCIGMLSSYKSQLHQLRNTVSDNITTIQEESSNQVLVIKLSSSSEMKILNFTAEFNLSIMNKQKTEYSHKYGIYILHASGTIHDSLSLSWITNPTTRKFQYFKLGSFLYDNRILDERVGWVSTGKLAIHNFSLHAGDHYVIFYAGFYDVPNINTDIQTKISINIIDIPDDLKVMKNEEGTFYGLWYGEFNPVFALTKGWVFDVMFNGTTQFSVNNTFLFRFDGHPTSDGFWNIYWETPMGIKQCNLEVKDGVFNSSSSEDEVNWCISGQGESGRYLFTTQYFDRRSGGWRAFPIYLSAIDVPLN